MPHTSTPHHLWPRSVAHSRESLGGPAIRQSPIFSVPSTGTSSGQLLTERPAAAARSRLGGEAGLTGLFADTLSGLLSIFAPGTSMSGDNLASCPRVVNVPGPPTMGADSVFRLLREPEERVGLKQGLPVRVVKSAEPSPLAKRVLRWRDPTSPISGKAPSCAAQAAGPFLQGSSSKARASGHPSTGGRGDSSRQRPAGGPEERLQLPPEARLCSTPAGRRWT